MIARIKYVVPLFVVVILAGCGGANTRYAWNNYDAQLYEHYKEPAQKEEFILALKEIIVDAESENKVPPGIYAEYGFLMYEKGDIAQAVLYYQKEADKWPESKFLMAKMIANTQKQPAKHDSEPKPVSEQPPVAATILTPTTPPATTVTTTSTPTINQDKTDRVEVLR